MVSEELIGLGAFAAFSSVLLVIFLGVYVFEALAMQSIAKKLKHKNPWWAWIPVLNVVQVIDLVKMSRWWALILLAPIVPIVGGLAFYAILIWWGSLIMEDLDYPGWYSLLLLIPVVNLVVLAIVAWSNKPVRR